MPVQESSARDRKPRGELETNGVDQLPPTPITESAHQTLLEMGLTEELIQQLRELAASFRYDLCREKLKRIAEQTILVQKKNKREQLILPYFFDAMGRFDGQCGDIGLQFLAQSHFSGLMEDINATASLPPGERLLMSHCYGRSPTHFCQEGATHVWNGLVQVDAQNRLIDYVLIDAAFQVIDRIEETQYQPTAINYGVTEINNGLVHAVQRVHEFDLEKNTFETGIDNFVVLGMSDDWKYSYGLSFVRPKESGRSWMPFSHFSARNRFIPVLARIDANGENDYFCFHPFTNRLEGTIFSGQLPPEEKDEIIDLLEICQGFTYRDASKAEIASHKHEMTIKW